MALWLFCHSRDKAKRALEVEPAHLRDVGKRKDLRVATWRGPVNASQEEPVQRRCDRRLGGEGLIVKQGGRNEQAAGRAASPAAFLASAAGE